MTRIAFQSNNVQSQRIYILILKAMPRPTKLQPRRHKPTSQNQPDPCAFDHRAINQESDERVMQIMRKYSKNTMRPSHSTTLLKPKDTPKVDFQATTNSFGHRSPLGEHNHNTKSTSKIDGTPKSIWKNATKAHINDYYQQQNKFEYTLQAQETSKHSRHAYHKENFEPHMEELANNSVELANKCRRVIEEYKNRRNVDFDDETLERTYSINKVQYTPKRTENREREIMSPSFNHEELISKNKPEVEYDYRIHNLDRINGKIKGLLDGKSAQRDKPDEMWMKSPIHVNKEIQEGLDIDRLTNKDSITLNRTPSKLMNYDWKPKPDYKKKAIERRANKFSELSHTNYEQTWNDTPQRVSRHSKLSKKSETRSRSCLPCAEKSIPTTPSRVQEDKLKYEEIQDQIRRFKAKIVEMQAEKQKLNISFKQTQRFGATPLRRKDFDPLEGQGQVKHVESQDYQGQIISSQRRSEVLQESPYIDLKQFQTPNESYIPLQNDKTQYLEFQLCNQPFNKHSLGSYMDSQSMSEDHHETESLMRVFQNQVKLDCDLRMTKQWFEHWQNPAKVKQLDRLIAQKWRQMSQDELEMEFSTHCQEQDPFYTYRQGDYELNDLVSAYILSQQHWYKQIMNRWDVSQLDREGFFSKVSSSGVVSVEKLVRELNKGAVCYHTRDVWLMVSRASGHQGLRVDVLKALLGRKK